MESKKNNNKFYVVKEGFKSGIYNTWDECKNQTQGYNKPIFKKFDNYEDAEKFLEGDYNLNDIKINDNILAKLEYGSFDFNEEHQVLDWNKYNNNYYIFTDGSEKKIRKNSKSITKFAIYLGDNCNNILQREYDSTNNRCELLAIKYALDLIIKYKQTIKHLQNNKINIEESTSNNEVKSNKVIIVSDSEYCVNSCKKWIFGWQKNGWKTKTNKDVKNYDIMSSILLNINKCKIHKVNIDFMHINSHKPPPLSDKYKMFLWRGNQIADKLAQKM